MSLHRLTTITVGVPDVDQTASYYTDFGLTPLGGNAFATVDGGEQFRLTRTAQRRLIEIGIGVDDADDLDRIERQLGALDLPVRRDQASISALEPIAGFRAIISIAPRISQERAETPPLQRTWPYRASRSTCRGDPTNASGTATQAGTRGDRIHRSSCHTTFFH